MNLKDLDASMQQAFARAITGDLGVGLLGLDVAQKRRAYLTWLVQAAHLTQYTSSHQALVAVRVAPTDAVYSRYCLQHAMEELGHEKMALHDLAAMGLDAGSVASLPPELPSTAALTAWLYYSAERAHPATRLGYTFWAERCYPILAPIFGNTRSALGLDKAEMRFFVAHAAIDEAHGREVVDIVPRVCVDDAAWGAVDTGLRTSLGLAIAMFGDLGAVARGTHPLTPKYDAFFGSSK